MNVTDTHTCSQKKKKVLVEENQPQITENSERSVIPPERIRNIVHYIDYSDTHNYIWTNKTLCQEYQLQMLENVVGKR